MSKRWHVNVEWDGHYWVGVLDDHQGVTQSKRLDLLRARLVEVVELMHDTKIEVDDLDLTIHGGRNVERAAAVRQLRDEIADKNEELSRETGEVVRRLRKEGRNMRDIGELVGVSYQRVHQLLDH